MQMAKFEAGSMPEALEKVRAVMGEEAMIVRSRTVRKGGLFGLARRDCVEVCATRNRPDEAAPPAEAEDRFEPSLSFSSGRIQEHLEAVNSKLDTLLLGLGVGTLRRPTTERPGQPEEALCSDEVLRGLAARLPLCGGLALAEKPTVVAVVGPTGVGKTTTLLKLAGQFSLRHGHRVTLVTADTFRLGAVEQLKAFSRVFRVNLRVTLSPEEMAQALRELHDQDLILVDTPGGSQRDRLYQSQLGAFLQAAEPAETHLVLSATSRPSVIRECIQIYSEVSADRIIFTKLDEAVCLQEVFSAALGSGLPISYLACGQQIPDDLQTATEEQLAEVMIGTDLMGVN